MMTRWRRAAAALLTLTVAACDGAPEDAAKGTPDVAVVEPEPGRVTWRRLSRFEYDNTVRDLLGTELRPGLNLPADDLGYGFDNVAEVLTLSPLHLELYEHAAATLVDEALTPPITEPLDLIVDGQALTIEGGEVGATYGDDLILFTSGVGAASFDVPLEGTWTARVRAWGDQAGPDPAQMVVLVDGAPVSIVDVTAASKSAAGVFETEPMTLAAGRHRVAVEFTNDYYDEATDPPGDRNLWIDYVALHGPEETRPLERWTWTRVISCSQAEIEVASRSCAESVIRGLAKRAFRRPVDDAEVARLLGLFDVALADGAPFLEALSLPLRAILMAPQFIFRTERAGAPGAIGPEPLSGYEIAVRLSYMLWSSMPDQALFDAAAAGDLDAPAGIAAQVRRMLRDPRAEALVDSFAAQWLYIRDVDNVFPDLGTFVRFDEDLRAAMREEMRRFFRTFVTEDRSMIELLTASETFVNRRLAGHYQLDVDLPDDETWARVSTAGTARRGLLTQAGLLTALSTPFRTSIVRRGKWVLGQLLCDAPKPPPAGVEALLDGDEEAEAKTLRQMMEQHVDDPFCASCHTAMDPIGFALEHFDGIGRWRDDDRGLPIDASGRFPDGTTFDGAVEMVEALADDPRFPRCVAEKVFTYALGRGMREDVDRAYLDAATDAFEAGGYRLEALLVAVATSDPFRFRRAEEEVR